MIISQCSAIPLRRISKWNGKRYFVGEKQYKQIQMSLSSPVVCSVTWRLAAAFIAIIGDKGSGWFVLRLVDWNCHYVLAIDHRSQPGRTLQYFMHVPANRLFLWHFSKLPSLSLRLPVPPSQVHNSATKHSPTPTDITSPIPASSENMLINSQASSIKIVLSPQIP